MLRNERLSCNCDGFLTPESKIAGAHVNCDLARSQFGADLSIIRGFIELGTKMVCCTFISHHLILIQWIFNTSERKPRQNVNYVGQN